MALHMMNLIKKRRKPLIPQCIKDEEICFIIRYHVISDFGKQCILTKFSPKYTTISLVISPNDHNKI